MDSNRTASDEFVDQVEQASLSDVKDIKLPVCVILRSDRRCVE